LCVAIQFLTHFFDKFLKNLKNSKKTTKTKKNICSSLDVDHNGSSLFYTDRLPSKSPNWHQPKTSPNTVAPTDPNLFVVFLQLLPHRRCPLPQLSDMSLEEKGNNKPDPRTDLDKKKKNLKSTVVCVFFSCCRWRWSSPPTGKGIGEETVPDPPIRLDFLCGGAWTQAPPAAAARGEDTLPLLPPSKGFSALLLNPRSCTDVPRIVPDFQQQLFLL